MTGKHSKRPSEPDPGLDPEPYESSTPGPDAVQRSGSEEQALASVGEAPAGDGVEGAQTADEGGAGGGAEGRRREGDGVDVELVNDPDQPNLGPPQTAPAPQAPRREHG
ncbi:MAG TPA: hypothetical protein VFL94_03165 [Actinomycetales bacterium]|nr:hypothetical protein [Actinomycetales bacterium]